MWAVPSSRIFKFHEYHNEFLKTSIFPRPIYAVKTNAKFQVIQNAFQLKDAKWFVKDAA